MPDDFALLSHSYQRFLLDGSRTLADWKAANGPLGGVIRHLRDRAAATRRTAAVFLVMLVIAVVTGLGFYLGLPFWQTWADGRQKALEEIVTGIEVNKADLDSQRAVLLRGVKLTDGETEVAGLPALLKDAFVTFWEDLDSRGRTLIVHGDQLFVFGRGGTVRRLTTDGVGFEAVPSDTDQPFFGAISFGDRLFIFGDKGAVRRLTADGAKFEPVPSDTNENLWDAIAFGDRLFLFGAGGVVLRLTADGAKFEVVPSDTPTDLMSAIEFGGRLFLFDSNGVVRRLTVDGTGFEWVPNGLDEAFWDAIAFGDRLFLFSSEGGVSRLTADGARFEALASVRDVGFAGAIAFGDRLFLFGNRGPVVATTNALSDAAAALPVDTVEDSLAKVEAFFQALPPHLRDWEPVRNLRNRLLLVASERAGLERIEKRVRDDIGILDNSPLQYLRDRKALDFKGFLEGCRGEAATADLTTVCLTAWQSEQATGQRSWWETLADQLPPGILLLFLLVYLGGLYRYNLRLAGFHESRADALQLLAHGRDENQLRDILAGTPGEAVNLATIFLAADKVEMGAIKAKLGQAEIELAKTMQSAK